MRRGRAVGCSQGRWGAAGRGEMHPTGLMGCNGSWVMAGAAVPVVTEGGGLTLLGPHSQCRGSLAHRAAHLGSDAGRWQGVTP